MTTGKRLSELGSVEFQLIELRLVKPRLRVVADYPRREARTASRSSGLTRTSRALDPSLGPTTPRDSIRSISRPALANPTRSLRCNIDVEPNWVLTTSSTACRRTSRSSPMSSSISFFAAAGEVTSPIWTGSLPGLRCKGGWSHRPATDHAFQRKSVRCAGASTPGRFSGSGCSGPTRVSTGITPAQIGRA